jgi:uncharacterized protein (TIGR03437 family)
MPTSRMGPFTGAIGSRIYVVGGETDTAVLSVNEIYDPAADTWSFGAVMPTARWNGGSAVVNNILYAIGGQTTTNVLTVVEAYDPATNRWSTKAPMPVAIDSMYAAVIGNVIYIVGGYNPPGGRLATVLAYDTVTDTWSAPAPLKVGKSQSALGVFGSTIVSAGGLLGTGSATTDTESFNPATNTWTTLTPLPSPRHAGCFESAGNKLYFAGGHAGTGQAPLATMVAYNADTNSWTTGLPVMPHAAVNMGSANLGGRMYCFGGTNIGTPLTGTIYNFVQIYQPDLPPGITPGGVVSASAFGQFSSVSPGSWIEIYGNNLANNTRGWAASDFTGTGSPGNTAPTSLDGVFVTIGGKSAFVDYISPGQINALLPSDTPLGNQLLTVNNPQGTSGVYALTVNPTQAGLLAPPSFNIGGVQYAVAIFNDGVFALPPGALAGVNSRPAKPGDVLTLYGVGFGPVTPNIPAGQIAQQLSTLALPFQLSIGGVPASLLYYGLAPNFTGLYQFNITVPFAAPGNAALTFTVNGVPETQTLSIPIAQ